MKLLLMRHGETNFNRLGLCNDDPSIDVHLSEQGVQQAQAAAELLRNQAVGCIVVSELPRTRQTADIVNQHHHAPIHVEPRLNDIRSGFEGRPVADYFATVGENRLHGAVNGGESMLDYGRRVLPVLDTLDHYACDRLLMVVHEETLRVLVARLHGLDDEQMMRLNFRNCEIIEEAWLR